MRSRQHTRAGCARLVGARSLRNLIPRELILSSPVISADREALVGPRSQKKLQLIPLETSFLRGLPRPIRLLRSPGNLGMAISSSPNLLPMGKLSCFPPDLVGVGISNPALIR